MTTDRNPDSKMVAIIALLQLGAVFFGVLSAAALKKHLIPVDGQGYDYPYFMFVLNWGLFLGIVPLIWTTAVACLCRLEKPSGVVRTAVIISGLIVATLLFCFMLYSTWRYIFYG